MQVEIQKSLFENEATLNVRKHWTEGVKTADRQSDYEAFVNKFKPKPKLTTDDCYTPPAVMECVTDWAKERYNEETGETIRDEQIIRPFKPDGDFESEDYSGKVVIDNPPFSILAKIIRFYSERGIPFFLFAPHLTNLQYVGRCTCVVVGVDIIYHNGARVKTGFVTNMFGGGGVIVSGTLHRELTELQRGGKTAITLPKYVYPEELVTASRLWEISRRGVDVSFGGDEIYSIARLQSQKAHGKEIFGRGFLIGREALARLTQTEREAKQKDNRETIVFELSEAEKRIVEGLG